MENLLTRKYQLGWPAEALAAQDRAAAQKVVPPSSGAGSVDLF